MSAGDCSSQSSSASPRCRPAVSSDIWRLWAKSSQAEPELYHPLICHLIDVASVAEALWDHSLPAPSKQLIRAALGMENEEVTRAWLAFLAGLHDIGKASPAFQSKVPQLKAALNARGFEFFPGAEAFHGLVSAKVIAELLTSAPLTSTRIPQQMATELGVTLGGHHGTFPRPSELGSSRLGERELGNGRWHDARVELFNQLCAFVRPDSVPGSSVAVPASVSSGAMALIAGLTSVADWIGSSETHFPYAPDCGDIETYGVGARQRAIRALEETGWAAWQPPCDTADFASLFTDIEEPRPMQRKAIQLAEQLLSPGLVLIEAPTGEGKTEAASYLADQWNRRMTNRGSYVAMPTQATANAMFERFREYLGKAYPGQTVDFHLVHGQASLSDRYQEMLKIGPVYQNDQIGDGGEGTTAAHGWFSYKKRGVLSPFAVGTVDQALLSVLQSRHVFVRLFGLGGKIVIFDEVHAYDTYTSTLLERLLQWLSALGSSVIMLSATLPSSRRDALLRAYAGQESSIEHSSYPSVTWVCGDQHGSVSFPVQAREPLRIRWAPPGTEELSTHLLSLVAHEGCAAIVCNTVRRAQETYAALQKAMGDCDVELDLFHARYPFGERQEREKRCVSRFGKEAWDRPSKAILVATQVIEQSIDIDFDVMVTEPAPIDLVLQRAGRLQRFGHMRRPEQFSEPEMWVIDPETDANGVPDFGSSARIYSEYVLLRSWLELTDRNQIEIPRDVSGLIEAVYTDQCACNVEDEALAQRLQAAWDDQQEKWQKLNYLARTGLIGPPDAKTPLWQVTAAELKDEEDPTIHPQLRAATRYSELPSVTLVCLHGSPEDCYLDRDYTQSVSLDSEPDEELTRALMLRSVSISNWRVYHHFVEHDPPRAWRRNALLRYLLPICFDANGRYEMDELIIELHRDLGIVFHYDAEE